jgi:hypothetical protein
MSTKIAANEYDQLGDTSTLADPSVVDDLVENRMKPLVSRGHLRQRAPASWRPDGPGDRAGPGSA